MSDIIEYILLYIISGTTLYSFFICINAKYVTTEISDGNYTKTMFKIVALWPIYGFRLIGDFLAWVLISLATPPSK